jgi:hypothetical protein
MGMVSFPDNPPGVLTELFPMPGVSWLTFIDPYHLVRTSLPVWSGQSEGRSEKRSYPVWHIEVDFAAGVAVTSPSILVPEEYHSAAQVRWRLVRNNHLERECSYLPDLRGVV